MHRIPRRSRDSSATAAGKKTPTPVGAPSRMIFLIPFLTDVAGMLFVFTVGRYLAESGAGSFTLGLVGAAHAAALSMSSVVFGPLSDKRGRHRIILPGMLVFLTIAVISASVRPGSAVVLVAYWMSAFALGMIHPATVAWINAGNPASKSLKSHGVSTSLIRFCISWKLGVLVAQAGGGALFLVDTNLPFVVAAGVMALDIVVLSIVVRLAIRRQQRNISESPPANHDRVAHAPSTREITDYPDDTHPSAAEDTIDSAAEARSHAQSVLFVRLAWLANLGGAVAISMMLHLFPRLAVGLGIPADRHGAILASMRVITIAIYLLLHRTGFWHYRFSVNAAAQLVCVAGLVVIFFAQSSAALIIGVCCVAVLVGFIYFSGIYYSSAGHDDSRRGFASGMHEATLGIGIAFGSAVGGLLGDVISDRIPYLLSAAVVVVLLGIQTHRFIKTTKKPLAASIGRGK